ncbi:hypothetical protein [Paenibacillus lupini]|uniref:hypothetical protein n=1 Tax=Paenibacillus lupini TaxID=1450204 RepID=UPI0014238B7D|nr:hypothetical protein [Paenibacillus lupini]NIK24321.1 hypothetical protein [Paenibacillus lupini]
MACTHVPNLVIGLPSVRNRKALPDLGGAFLSDERCRILHANRCSTDFYVVAFALSPIFIYDARIVEIEYDQSQISSEQLKKIVTDYLSYAASNSSTSNNWEEMLKPYQLRIEKLGDAKKTPVIAEKDIGSTEINWLFE